MGIGRSMGRWQRWQIRAEEAAPTPAYTIVAYADGPAKFLSGEVADEETVTIVLNSTLLKGPLRFLPFHRQKYIHW
ncbi:MAG: hypothetical protein HZA12_08050 [Nitrospirae bacterium]|nr:hypothetical protein [Nitrospirota bacterium]